MSTEAGGHPIYETWSRTLQAAVQAVGPEGEGLQDPAAHEPVRTLLEYQRTWEEGVLFPRLARYFVGGGPVPVMASEHRDLERRWAAFDPADPESRKAFSDALRLHVRKESLSLVQVARVRLSRREWEALAETAQEMGLAVP